MTAYNVVHMRVKAGREDDFLEMNRSPGHEVKAGLRKAALLKTGDRSYCFVGEWESIDAIVAARVDMIDDLNRMRDMLEDLGNGMGVTHAVSGTAIAENDLAAEAAMKDGTGAFNFSEFKRAFENQDVEAWLSFYDESAEWLEYRHANPPRAPNRMTGKKDIGTFLGRVKGSNVQLKITDEIIGDTRAAFCVIVTMASGKRIIEHIIVHFARGKIMKQVDVEAWD
jgi:hypothetical protein